MCTEGQQPAQPMAPIEHLQSVSSMYSIIVAERVRTTHPATASMRTLGSPLRSL